MLQALIDELPPIVQRRRVGMLTQGLINPRTMANLDCQGVGPKNRFMIGGKVCYPVESFKEWLQEQVIIPQQNN